uniref:Putative ovule protein n=1 Tax=Solanum chacoense TaxID=4108 RepID=A0A0V0GUU6_SOLCH
MKEKCSSLLTFHHNDIKLTINQVQYKAWKENDPIEAKREVPDKMMQYTEMTINLIFLLTYY